VVALHRTAQWLKGLSGRLVLGALVIHLLLIPLLLGVVFKVMETALQDQFINEVRTISGLLANRLTLLDPVHNADEIGAILDDVVLGGLIPFAELRVAGREAIRGTVEMQYDVNAFQEDIAFGQHGDTVYFLSIPLHFSGSAAPAWLLLGFDEIPVKEQITAAYWYMVLLLAGYAAIGISMLAFLGHTLTDPLQRLRTISHRIAQGKVREQITVETEISDIAELAVDLEHMRSKLVEQTERLEYLALYDALTALPNRLLFNDRIQQAVLSGSRDNIPFALLMMDLNRFKEVNDTLGHLVGDQVLQQAAARLQAAVRHTDTAARLGGDEFAIVLPGSEGEGARQVAKQLRKALLTAYNVKGSTIFLDVSIGIALYPLHARRADELTRLADLSMYEAKRSGRSPVFYHADLQLGRQERFELTNDFRRGLECGELQLFYQPTKELKSGRICAVEALARWRHPSRGLILPGCFVPLAEQTGLIAPLTEQVFLLAAEQCYRWLHRQTDPGLDVAINLSAENLHDKGLPDLLALVCDRTSCPPDRLIFELTETAIFREPGHAYQIIRRLKAMGCRISIDDFGTGYSSLSRLKQLPFSEIKIDMSFVKGITENPDDLAIVKATINMAHDLGLAVVAEGVETEPVLDCLRELECDKVQGVLISPPRSAEALDRWFKGNGLWPEQQA